MASQIDPTKPVEGRAATTQSVRDNFSAAKIEIEALQDGKADLSGADFTGDVSITGTLSFQAGSTVVADGDGAIAMFGGPGASAILFGGDATATNEPGGDAQVNGGNGNGTGAGGAAYVTGGFAPGSGAGGDVVVAGGPSVSGASGRVHIARGDLTVWQVSSANAWQPGTDNAYSLGGPSNRPSQLYAGTGTINTSDQREKSPPRPATAAELAVAVRLTKLPAMYQWLTAIAAKGEDGARIHCGPTAQAVAAAFEAEGLDPLRYGVVCHDAWDAATEMRDPKTGAVTTPAREAGDRWGLRYDELAMWCAVGLNHRLSQLEG